MNMESLSTGPSVKNTAGESAEVTSNTPPRIRGKTFIEDDVIAIIARIAAEQVSGVHQIGETKMRSLFSRLGRHHGVEAETGLKEAAADLEIVVEFAYPIQDVTENVRERVIEAVESMADRKVVEVNIFVMDIHVPKSVGTRRRRELE